MVFKIIISFNCGLYRFYPVLPMGKTDCFTQFYPILPNWFYPLGKTTLPTLHNRNVDHKWPIKLHKKLKLLLYSFTYQNCNASQKHATKLTATCVLEKRLFGAAKNFVNF